MAYPRLNAHTVVYIEDSVRVGKHLLHKHSQFGRLHFVNRRIAKELVNAGQAVFYTQRTGAPMHDPRTIVQRRA